MHSSFYVIDESTANYPQEDTSPLEFGAALTQAQVLLHRGHSVRVLYTDEATPAEIRRFTDEGILAELASTQ